MPDSVETPAPVKATTREARCSSSISSIDPMGARLWAAAAGTREHSALDEAPRRVVHRRDLAETPLLEVLERLHDLGLGVHHERAAPGDRLADRPATEDDPAPVA